jgi:uncharacterized protein (TIGR00369 family)
MTNLPDGYEPHFRQSPVTAPWEPLYSRWSDDAVAIGFHLAEPHCNSRGLLHGGVIAALADNAMGLSYTAAHAKAFGAGGKPLTVSLNIDYVAPASIGQWVEMKPHVVRAGRSMGFVEALVTADGATVARASATFRMPAEAKRA